MLIHPTVERLRALGLVGHGRRLHRTAEHARRRRADPRRLARPPGRPRGDQPREQAPGPPAARGEAAPGRRRRGRQPARASRPRPRPVPKTRHLRMGARSSPSGRHRPDRHRQVVVGLCPRPQSLPRRLLGALQARQPPVRRPDPGPRRGSPAAPAWPRSNASGS